MFFARRAIALHAALATALCSATVSKHHLSVQQPCDAEGRPALPSGEFIPLSAPGRLVCPQSLTTLEGIGHCVGITPLGAAPVGAGARGADVFVQCKAQMGPPQGGTFTYR